MHIKIKVAEIFLASLDGGSPDGSTTTSEVTTMRLMITGHRPNKLGGYRMDSAIAQHIDGEIRRIVAKLDPRTDIAICGMAQGVDQLFARICMEFHIPVHAYIPFIDQDNHWPAAAQKTYKSLIDRCDKIFVCNKTPSKSAFLLRNAMMVKNADQAIAVWDGSSGGTAHTVSLIGIAGLPCHRIRVSA